MNWLKVIAITAMMIIAGMYGWYLMATAINHHADQAATVIIQDTLSANSAHHVRKLTEAANLLNAGNHDQALAIISSLVESNIYFLESCLTEQCKQMRQQIEQ